MPRYACPYGCNVSYSRGSDLKRRHLRVKHGRELSEEERKPKVSPTQQEYLLSPEVSFDNCLSASTSAHALTQRPTIPSPTPSQIVTKVPLPQEYSPLNPSLMFEQQLPVLNQLQHRLRLLSRELENAYNELGRSRAQLHSERANTQRLFDVLRRTRMK